MRTLKSVLETGAESGVFWLMSPAPKEEISQQAAKIDAAYFHIEGKKLHGKTQFLNHVATALSFPDYFVSFVSFVVESFLFSALDR